MGTLLNDLTKVGKLSDKDKTRLRKRRRENGGHIWGTEVIDNLTTIWRERVTINRVFDRKNIYETSDFNIKGLIKYYFFYKRELKITILHFERIEQDR